MMHHGTDLSLLRLLPNVLRARDFRLYLEGGKRLVDLWRWGGQAILGHKPPKVLLELKNAAERGLFTPLPHPLQRRFVKALLTFFPGRVFRLYQNEASLYRALAAEGFPAAPCDPAFPRQDGEDSRIFLWRPFFEPPKIVPDTQIVQSTILIPVLPCTMGMATLVLPPHMEDSFPPSELIPPAVLAPAARALFNLAATLKTFDEKRWQCEYPKVRKAIDSSPSAGKHWRRRGMYLTVDARMDSAEYEALFRRFLEGGFLLPPSQAEPAILPLVMSPGEEAKLAKMLAAGI